MSAVVELECWRPIPSWPGFEASTFGRIRRVVKGRNGHKPRILKGSTNVVRGRRYAMIQTTIGSVHSKRIRHSFVHRLVCEAFHGEAPRNKPFALHRDDDSENNRPDNLRWGSHAENMRDMALNGRVARGSRQTNAKLDELDVVGMYALRKRGWSTLDIADVFGVNKGTAARILSDMSWTHLRELLRRSLLHEGLA